MESIRLFVQSTLEQILNTDGEEGNKVSAKDEPALQVTLRHPPSAYPNTFKNYGFLNFASHAAASMALATLTDCTDGGYILRDKLAPHVTLRQLQNVSLHWAKGDNSLMKKEEQNKRYPPADTRKDCWFCLASPTCERHLIISVGKSCYTALPRGSLDTHHVLIVPVAHETRGSAYLSLESYKEMEDTKENIRSFVRKSLKKDLFVFERAMQTKGGYHCHVQCVPIVPYNGNGRSVEDVMMGRAEQIGFELKEIPDGTTLQEVLEIEEDAKEKEGSSIAIGSGYFYAEVPVGKDGGCKRYVCRMKPRAKSTPQDNNKENNQETDVEKPSASTEKTTEDTKPSSNGNEDKKEETATTSSENDKTNDKSPPSSSSSSFVATVPLQFGREIVARYVDNPALVEWKECVVSTEEEERMANTFREAFESNDWKS
eukprot:5692342-Ditylum_brightwellii.AAC.1